MPKVNSYSGDELSQKGLGKRQISQPITEPIKEEIVVENELYEEKKRDGLVTQKSEEELYSPASKTERMSTDDTDAKYREMLERTKFIREMLSKEMLEAKKRDNSNIANVQNF